MSDKSWDAIAKHTDMLHHDFSVGPFKLSAKQIKIAVHDFKETNEKEVRILCKQDTREDRPKIFQDNNLFLLPTKNGEYAIIKGEGYYDIPELQKSAKVYPSKLDFHLDTSQVGNSEMQHLDFAYASSLIRSFMDDPSLVLTIRGRKYTPHFTFRVGKNQLAVEGVQTEVDAGYEGRNQVVLVEAKNPKNLNTIIRQLFYPFRQWQAHTSKPVKTLFFQKDKSGYALWQFIFNDVEDYNSIQLVRSQHFKIEGH